jgi:hypothetical protein
MPKGKKEKEGIAIKPQKESKEIPTVQLAEMLNINYQQLIRIQSNIFEINAEIKKRQNSN